MGAVWALAPILWQLWGQHPHSKINDKTILSYTIRTLQTNNWILIKSKTPHRHLVVKMFYFIFGIHINFMPLLKHGNGISMMIISTI